MISFNRFSSVFRAAAAMTSFALCAAMIAPVASAQMRELSPSVVFTNSTAITVTSGGANNAVPYPSGITVSGISGTIPATPGSVKVTLNNFSHTFPDDLGLVLVGPTGAALLLQDGAGDDPDMVSVTYTLSDDGATTLPATTAWTAGTYKPTAHFTGDSFPAPGPGTAYGNPGPAGSGTATFSSVFGGTDPNGTWNLYVRDFVTGDGGSFAGGWSLEINPGAVTPVQHVLDYDGDGKTDRVVVRNIGGGANGQIRWFINRAGDGSTVASDWGLASDFFVSGDFDGDQKSDIAVWRPIGTGQPSGNAFFYVLNSSNGTVVIEDFGQTGDDPTVVGDYNGDGKTDFAVYRGGASAGQQSTWFYRTTSGGPINYQGWGQNGDFPAPGDYDGDGKNDFAIQRNNGGGQGAFWLHQTTAGDSIIVFGTPTDVIVPGDYDGDGKTDIATVRGSGGAINWFVRPSSTGIVSAAPYAVFGASATDIPSQGDYDGDGKTDVAVWRGSATPGASAFWFLGSTSGAVGVPFGATGDYPVANFNSH